MPYGFVLQSELILSTVELAAEVIFELLTDLLYKHIKTDWQT